MKTSWKSCCRQLNTKYGEMLAENGLCFLVETFYEDNTTTVLFDAGLTGPVVLHNARLLGVDLHDVDAVVISHGHPDHFGPRTEPGADAERARRRPR
jgi:metal-dependent hydrolase (beta-lactamase superfamily II)